MSFARQFYAHQLAHQQQSTPGGGGAQQNTRTAPLSSAASSSPAPASNSSSGPPPPQQYPSSSPSGPSAVVPMSSHAHQAALGGTPDHPLKYSVAEASSHSGNYHPNNILVDRPNDLTSRWSGASVASMSGSSSGGAGGSSAGAGAGTGTRSGSSSANTVSGAGAGGHAGYHQQQATSTTSSAASGGGAGPTQQRSLAAAGAAREREVASSTLSSASPTAIFSIPTSSTASAGSGGNGATSTITPQSLHSPLPNPNFAAYLSGARGGANNPELIGGAAAPPGGGGGAGRRAAPASSIQQPSATAAHPSYQQSPSPLSTPPVQTGSSPTGPPPGSASTASAPSSSSASTKQYVLLRLDKPAVVRKIVFGKYHKPHPCNLADFKVYGSPIDCVPDGIAGAPAGFGTGASGEGSGGKNAAASEQVIGSVKNASAAGPGRWVRLLRAGLRNDSVKEEFDLRYTDEHGVPFAVRYIKVVPLAAHQPKYNFSVWYIGLLGIKDPHLVSQLAVDYSNHSESNATRLILKHLRTRGHFSAFESLLKSSKLGPPPLPVSSSTTDLSASQSLASGKQALGAADRRAPAVTRSFEHPLVTNLFDTLVKRGAWEEAEAWLEQAAFGSGRNSPSANDSVAPLFSEYLSRTLPKPTWEPIETERTADGDDAPCGRGGHQMCLDSENGIAYLFGGWDGQRDLSDFWAYHIKEKRWRLFSSDAKEQGGPGARSCHKMCYCPRTGFIYVLGRFVDQDKQLELAAQALSGAPIGENGSASSGNTGSGAARAASLLDALLSTGNVADASGETSAQSTPRTHSPNLGTAAPAEQPSSHAHALSDSLWQADFYRFSTRTGQWTLLSHDTAIEGGPRLIYDHQMLVDPESQLLYVFGGRVIYPGNPNRIDLSGMYRYDVIQRKWAFMFDDSTSAQSRIPSRVGHSMLIDTKPNGQRQLWIMSGQRGDRYLTDMWQYNPSTGRCNEVTRDYFANGPHAGFTPRAALDSKAREIYYFTGLVQRRNSNERVRSSFWLYSMTTNSWSLIYEYGGVNSEVNKERTNAVTASLALTEGASNDLDAMDEDMPMESSAASASSEEPTSFGFDSSSVNEDMSSFFVREKEPRPRYAAQMVFDPRYSAFYMFGGNPADVNMPSMRLDDFWKLTLVRPTVADVLRQTRFLVRQQRFYEMARSAKSSGYGGLASPAAMQALTYLQTEVSAVVNHSDEGESAVFRKLMSHLLGGGGNSGYGSGNVSGSGSMEDIRETAELSQETTPRAQNKRRRAKSGHTSATSSDGLEDLEDSDMLSISQIIDQRENASSAVLLEEGKPTELYRQRAHLFNKLLSFFPSDCVEPAGELPDAVALLSARMINRST